MYKRWTETYTQIETYKPTNVIMTTYFCNKKDPQRSKKAPCNDFSYIKPWYNSVKKLNLNGIIFYDGLSDEFIKKYETSNIKFAYVNINDTVFSLNDIRYFIYLDYIIKNSNIKNIFMTDGNDITIVKNPFNIIQNNKIYVGSEVNGSISYLQDKYNKINNKSNNYKINKNMFFNAGILGGTRNQVIKFLQGMIDIFNNLDNNIKSNDVNMGVFNIVTNLYFFNNYVTGEPLHSKFKKFENDRKDVYFIHK